jgi:hypothetical protein
MDRIIKAFTFRKEVYGEVEKDGTFTSTAWLLVVVVSFINQLGGLRFAQFGRSLLGVIIGTVIQVAAFAIAAMVINLVGRALFKADVTFEELVRTLGLAYVWNIVGVLNILGPVVSCFVWPVTIIGWILLVISWFLAVKEALDLDWVPTIVTVVLGWLVILVFRVIAGVILGLLGVAAQGIGDVISG